MNNWFVFVLTALATWRISHLLTEEDGPWEIFFRLRVWAGAVWDASTAEWGSDKLLGQILTCPLCTSVWVSAIASGVLWVTGYLPEFSVTYLILWWLAVSGASSALEIAITND